MGELDPITREIIKNALATAGDEMAITLYRTAYSTIVRDCLDYSTQLTDADGNMIAQGVTIPLHIGSAPFAMKSLFEKFRDDIEPGDLFILNDPFDGGMHTPDIFIVRPIFWENERVAFAIATAHHLDVGGRVAGSSACDNTEIFQEGLRIPWLKLYRRGQPDASLFALLRANVRVPEMTLGDLQAQIAACMTGERHIHEIIGRYGLATFRECTRWLIDYTERILRAEIATWPDGQYSFTDYLDSDGVGGPPVRIQVTLTVKGDELTADFTGSSPQVRGAINSTLSYTASVTAACVRSLLGEELPNTAGMFRPLRIIAPEGTVVNVVMPGASSMRGVTGFRTVDTVFGALAQILPGRVMAAGEGGNTLVIFGGQRENRAPYVYYELLTGDWGGRPDRDGCDALCNPVNVASNIPIEEAECAYPIRIEHYGLARDSGGAGRFRGGLGMQRHVIVHTDATLTVSSDRRRTRPWGVEGGQPAANSRVELIRGDQRIELPGKITRDMQAGDELITTTPGGGGWDEPAQRARAAVEADVRERIISPARAQTVYRLSQAQEG